jgi:hypothetical protein
MNNATPNTFLDGNAPAGPLSEHLRGHRRSGRCANCERSSRMAETHVYRATPGVVIRCPGCQCV